LGGDLEVRTNRNFLQTINGRVIFVDYAKPNINGNAAMPIARGPPEPTPDT